MIGGRKGVVRTGRIAAMQMAAENQFHSQPTKAVQRRLGTERGVALSLAVGGGGEVVMGDDDSGRLGRRRPERPGWRNRAARVGSGHR